VNAITSGEGHSGINMGVNPRGCICQSYIIR
jgi:hypothetical protein